MWNKYGSRLKEFDEKLKMFNNPEWEIESFEANPGVPLDEVCTDVKNLKKFNKAVWINEDGIEFTLQSSKGPGLTKLGFDNIPNIGTGSEFLLLISIYSKKMKTITVATFNFAKYLVEKSKNDYTEIHCKMDIEGAEFEVLRYLVKYNVSRLLNYLCVET